MKRLKVKSCVSRLAALTASLLFAQHALAVGTPAGTTIQNTVSATYSVGGAPQDQVVSNPATFRVDQQVSFSLTESGGAPTTVTPGQTDAVTTFLLTNLGNASQDFDLSAVNLNGGSVHGNTDNVDVENPPRVFVDDGDAVFGAGDTALFVDELSPDAGSNSVTIFVVANVSSSGIVNGDFANVSLSATAHDAGAGGTLGALTTDDAGSADDPNLVQVVFATAGGVDSAEDGYAVQSADITVTKTSEVLNDLFSAAGEAKAIPGATVQYEITIANAGPVAATGIGLVDPLDANVTLATGGYAGDDAEVLIGGASFATCTLDADDSGDGDGCGLFNGGTEVRIAPAGFDLQDSGNAPNNEAIVRFSVTIN